MKRLLVAAALAAAALTAVPATAQVNMHQERQQERIERGVRSGDLTGREAAHLERQQGRIARAEHRMRARNGGYLNRHQRRKLEMRQMRASRHIHHARHNMRHR